jgi:hypothetical protein
MTQSSNASDTDTHGHDLEFDPDWYDDACWNCGGDGVVYMCISEYACIDPEGGCDLCERRCDVCRPAKHKVPTP